MRSVKTRPPLRAWQGPPPRRPGLGRAPLGPLPPAIYGIRFRFLPSQLPAPRSFPLVPRRLGRRGPRSSPARGRSEEGERLCRSGSRRPARGRLCGGRGGGAAPGRGGAGAGQPLPGTAPSAGSRPRTYASPSLFQSFPPPSLLGPTWARPGGCPLPDSLFHRCQGQGPFDLSFGFLHPPQKPTWRGSGGRAV